MIVSASRRPAQRGEAGNRATRLSPRCRAHHVRMRPTEAKRMSRNNVTLHLAGSKYGPPTREQLIDLARKLTGREPTPEELAAGDRILRERSRGDAWQK